MIFSDFVVIDQAMLEELPGLVNVQPAGRWPLGRMSGRMRCFYRSFVDIYGALHV